MTGPRSRTGLRAARAIGLALIALGLSWALALAVFGGFEFTVGVQTITSNEPLRPLAIAAVGLAAVLWSYGFGRSAARWESLIERVNEGVVAVLLAAAVFGIGVVYGSTTAAAADSYGYVSQSDLWNAGDLRVEQPWVADVPWPEASWTFSPLGYRPDRARSARYARSYLPTRPAPDDGGSPATRRSGGHLLDRAAVCRRAGPGHVRPGLSSRIAPGGTRGCLARGGEPGDAVHGSPADDRRACRGNVGDGVRLPARLACRSRVGCRRVGGPRHPDYETWRRRPSSWASCGAHAPRWQPRGSTGAAFRRVRAARHRCGGRHQRATVRFSACVRLWRAR